MHTSTNTSNTSNTSNGAAAATLKTIVLAVQSATANSAGNISAQARTSRSSARHSSTSLRSTDTWSGTWKNTAVGSSQRLAATGSGSTIPGEGQARGPRGRSPQSARGRRDGPEREHGVFEGGPGSVYPWPREESLPILARSSAAVRDKGSADETRYYGGLLVSRGREREFASGGAEICVHV
jgi:hypothetical protein